MSSLRAAPGSLLRSGLAAGALALALTLPLAFLLNATVPLPAGFLPTSPVAVLLTVVVAIAAATAVYAALARWTARPRRNFLAVGAVGYAVSLAGPLSGLEAQFPGAGLWGAVAVVAMHTITAGAALGVIGRTTSLSTTVPSGVAWPPRRSS